MEAEAPVQAAFDLFEKTEQEELCVKCVEKKFADAGITLNDEQLPVVRDFIMNPSKPLNIPVDESQEADTHCAERIDWDDENDEDYSVASAKAVANYAHSPLHGPSRRHPPAFINASKS